MELMAAKKLAEGLMIEHNLTDGEEGHGWDFKFDNARRRFGLCSYRTKTISLSAPLTKLNDEQHVRNTILHEIAHALCPAGTHHGKLWVKTAKAIGCTGKRCYGDAVQKPKAKYTATCPNCAWSMPRFKLGNVACPECCKKHNGGKYHTDYKLVFTKTV